MPFTLSEVESETEFNDIWPVHFKAFQTPYNTYSKFFNPIHTTLDSAIEASKARHIQMWKANDACHWIKAVETESENVVGAVCWTIHDRGYAADSSPITINAHWHIEGSDEKTFAEKLIGGLKSFVAKRMTRPHLELNQMIVHPDFRRQGVGRRLIKWGTHKADELGVEMAVVAVPYAAPVYEKCGFGRVEQIDIDFAVPNPSEKWKEYEREDLRAFFMWKPAGRNYNEGVVVPWRLG